MAGSRQRQQVSERNPRRHNPMQTKDESRLRRSVARHTGFKVRTAFWSQPRAPSIRLKRLCSRPCYHRIPPPPIPAFFSRPPLKKGVREGECERGVCTWTREEERGRDRQRRRRRTGKERLKLIVRLFPLLCPHARSPQSCDLVAPSVGSAALKKAQPQSIASLLRLQDYRVLF